MKNQKQIFSLRLSLLLSLGIFLLLMFVRSLGAFQQIELLLGDLYYGSAPQEKTDSRFMLVGMNEADIKKLKTNQLSDYQLFEILSTISKGDPAAVGVDIFRDHPVPPNYWEIQELKERGVDVLSSKKPFGNEEFLSLFKEGSKFFAIGHQNGTEGDRDFASIAPPPIPQSQITDVGVVLDSDGYQRRGTLYPITNPPIPGLGWALALEYLKGKGAVIDGVDRHGGHHLRIIPNPYNKLGVSMYETLRARATRPYSISTLRSGYGINGKIFAEFSNFTGPYVKADDGGYQVYLHWRKANFQVVSVSDVLEERIQPKSFKNKIVIIGAFAPSLNDQFSTPLSASLTTTYHRRLYGIEAIAQVASYIISAVELTFRSFSKKTKK
jgi:CHASE2 domain-containing sensor protein